MESFAKMVPSYANVIRDKKLQNINAVELVVGDIIEVKFGDSVPADIRVVECSGFKVNFTSLFIATFNFLAPNKCENVLNITYYVT